MPSHPLTNFEIQKYYQNESRFNGVYSRNNEYESIGTHWITLYVNTKNLTYFDSFGDKHIPKEIRKFTVNKTYYKEYL